MLPHILMMPQENKGIVFFDKTVEYLRKTRFSHTEKSIRVYLGNLCRTVKDTSGNVFVYKPWVDRFKDLRINPERSNVSSKAIPVFVDVLKVRGGNRVSLRELKDAFYKKTGEVIKAVTARAILDKRCDLFSKEFVDGGKTVYFLNENADEKRRKRHLRIFTTQFEKK